MNARTDADVTAVRMMMERLGVTVDELTRTGPPHQVPTFAEYIPVVAASIPAGKTRDHLSTYWNKILAQAGWAEKALTEPTTADLRDLCEQIRQVRVIRRSDRGGNDVIRHVIDSLRRLYLHAEDNRVIDPRDNPTTRLRRPKQQPSNRRGLPVHLLAELVREAVAIARDPALDALLLRLHTETACRRGGALALRPQDLDPVQSLILLREKGGTMLWQPVSPTLMRALCRHAEQRGADPQSQLLRARSGRPITRRYYDRLFERLGEHLPWVHAHGVSAHWLRHTTITWVERHHGGAVASAFARHSRSSGSTTARYTTATLEEVAAAVAHLTGEPHPLVAASPALAAPTRQELTAVQGDSR
ncbi:tyrosine-type recombinase/integrase [Nocardia shimofusensis]|uniref:tyrosine-type recombinase/integrase n=1 Tax=Nocardia shimofusensis TaxID=228596 RepID=UPI000AE3B00C|nr:site-specific integrase [Nocardia shimofusensis]